MGWESRRKLAAAPVWGENFMASPELFCGAVPEEKYLTLDGFQRFVVDRSKQDIRSVWRAILSCGYDLHFERYSLHISWGAGTDPLGSLPSVPNPRSFNTACREMSYFLKIHFKSHVLSKCRS